MPYTNSPLDIWTAARKGLLAEVKGFINSGVDVNARTKGEIAPLHEAAEAGEEAVAEFLLEQGADPNAKTLPNPGDPGAIRALHLAVRPGHVGMVRLLLHWKANVNASMSDGKTPLIIASETGRLDIMKVLLDAGAKLNVQDVVGGSPLLTAILNYHIQAADLILQSGADINYGTGAWKSTPLMMCAQNKMLAEVEYLLKAGADVHRHDMRGETALHGAVIAAGARVTQYISDEKGRRFFEDKPENAAEITRLLLVAGADPFAQDRDGMTPISWAKKLHLHQILDVLEPSRRKP